MNPFKVLQAGPVKLNIQIILKLKTILSNVLEQKCTRLLVMMFTKQYQARRGKKCVRNISKCILKNLQNIIEA